MAIDTFIVLFEIDKDKIDKGHIHAVVLSLQVNAVVLCRVVMVTVSSARRRAKMLSPSSASKMQTFDLTW